MRSDVRSKQLAVAQARKETMDGIVTYYYSLPKISMFNIKGMIWLWKRLKAYKQERIARGDINAKIIYN